MYVGIDAVEWFGGLGLAVSKAPESSTAEGRADGTLTAQRVSLAEHMEGRSIARHADPERFVASVQHSVHGQERHLGHPRLRG